MDFEDTDGEDWEELDDNFNFKVYDNSNTDYESLEFRKVKVQKSSHAYLNHNIVFSISKDQGAVLLKS